ncbi:MAG: heme biosynthesis protein HemY, partial [Beijerinckiaceae bacterium]|nr:heme biosynthesis protein HemY [Beijerinckiaceae bacterium]
TRATADRQRAVLKTALAEQLRERDSAEALALAREAIKLAPDLTPASALAGSLLAQKGDLRRAGRILENAWKRAPHPDLARAYVDMRHGDAAGDRLNRARALARLAPGHAESQLAIARAALEARQFDLARRTMADLMDDGRRPTVRMCLMMADIEETEHGPTGRAREWLSRASRAPRDAAWIADGIVSDRWLPASPVTGQIDAFRWETPMERLAGPTDDLPLSVWPDPEPAPPLTIDAPASPAAPIVIAATAAAAAQADQPPAPEPAVVTTEAPILAAAPAGTPADNPLATPTAPVMVDATPAEAQPHEASKTASEAAPDKPDALQEPAAAPAAAPLSLMAAGAGAQNEADAPPAAARDSSGKPVLPERLVTAPDDPGLDEPAAPSVPEKPRKRGFFG